MQPRTKPGTSPRMSRERSRDTAAEWSLRWLLYARGLRYRVDAALPGLPCRRADLLFPRQDVVVFVDGFASGTGVPITRSSRK